MMRHGGERRGDRGAVTAELAVALPAVVMVLVVSLLVVMAGVAQLRVSDAARAGARAVAVGEEDVRVEEIVRHLAGADAVVRVVRGDPWVTVQVSAPAAPGFGGQALTASAEATAWLESAVGDPP